MDELKQRTKKFLGELSIPITAFSRNVGISAVAYHAWMRNDLKLSASTEERISNYLKKYDF